MNVAELLTRVVSAQPMPPVWVVLAALAIAAVGVLIDGVWRRARHVVTIAHEGGHALGAALTGRRLAGIRLHSDSSGLAVSVGRATGVGMVLTLAIGYLAPSLLGLAAAAALSTGRVTATLWVALVLLAGVLIQLRNFYGLLPLLLTGGVVFAVTYWAGPDVQAGFGYGVAWFLLLGGVRPVVELARSGRHRLGRSDADQLARLTRVPPLVWVGVFFATTVTALVVGGRLLLGA